MEFIQKAEDFVRQMSYSFAFDPEPLYQGKKGFYDMMIPADDFLKILDFLKIDYPFKPEIKIIELEGLMKQENISPLKAIKIVKNYVDHYWVADTVIIDKRIFEKIASIVKKDEGSDKNVLREQAKYTESCKTIRQKYFEELMTELGLTAEIANELGFPQWLKMKNLSASIKGERGGSIKFNPNKDGVTHIDFNSDEIADAFIEYGETKKNKSLTEEEKAQAKKKYDDVCKKVLEQEKKLREIANGTIEASDRKSITTSKLPEKKSSEDLESLPYHSFDGKTFEEIYDYFHKPLVGLIKDKPIYLDDETLREYITLAFFKQEIPKRQFSFLNFSESTGKIIGIFFAYYSLLPRNKRKSKEWHVKLLTDYFTQFDYKTTHGNWKSK